METAYDFFDVRTECSNSSLFSISINTASVVLWLALKTTNTEVPGSIPGHSLGLS
jgi:hypothetical protein